VYAAVPSADLEVTCGLFCGAALSGRLPVHLCAVPNVVELVDLSRNSVPIGCGISGNPSNEALLAQDPSPRVGGRDPIGAGNAGNSGSPDGSVLPSVTKGVAGVEIARVAGVAVATVVDWSVGEFRRSGTLAGGKPAVGTLRGPACSGFRALGRLLV